MADYYCTTSSYIEIPRDKIEQAKEIVNQVLHEIEEKCGYIAVPYKFDDDGIWIHGEINRDHVEIVVRELVHSLQLTNEIVCSWAYTCSKDRLDAFGGGAFAMRYGYETAKVDAMADALTILREQYKEDN